MKDIVQGAEPELLIKHRTSSIPDWRPTYDNIDPATKEQLRDSLLSAQGHLCAYCMARINKDNSHIEHWHPRKGPNKRPDKQLEYKNLLLVCDNGSKTKGVVRHCDASKGEDLIKFNPNVDRIEKRFKYSALGHISFGDDKNPTDLEFARQLNDILNLNTMHLKASRHGVLKQFKNHLGRFRGSASQDYLKRSRDAWLSKGADGSFKPYCMVIVNYIDKRIGDSGR